MSDHLLFGKPLPRGLKFKSASQLSWPAALALLAGAGVVTWVVMNLLARDTRETEDMVYFWPE